MPLTGRELLAKAIESADLNAAEETMVPDFDRFIKLHPNDTHFVLELQPGQGYGNLVCMEDDCFQDMQLEPHPNLPDGGIARGFGWLFKFQEHIKNDPRHIPSRNKRLARAAVVKSEQAPETFRTGSSSASSSKPSSYSSPATSSRPAVKDKKPFLSSDWDFDSAPRASGSGSKSNGLPKKRTSDLGPRSSAGRLFEDDDVVDKKPKLDVEPRVLADRKNAVSPVPDPDAGIAPHLREYKNIKEKLKHWDEILAEMRAMPLSERDDEYFSTIDTGNAQISTLRKKEEDWRRMYGAPPAQYGAAVPQPAVQNPFGDYVAQAAQAARDAVANAAAHTYGALGLGGLGGNAVAGPSNGRAGGADPIQAAMNAFSGARVGGADAGYDSDEERMWGQVGQVSSKDFDEFVKAAIEGDGFEGNANVNNAAKTLGLESQNDKLPHMNVKLLPHQIIGCAWMKQQEAGKYYGGILGDEMGLGKTVEAIACCIGNESRDPREKTTLVICPVALLEQWKTEIEEKVEKGYFSVAVYHGPERHKLTVKKLVKYDFVLTTYQTLVGEYPDQEAALVKARKAAKKNGGDPEDYYELGKQGPLLQMTWYRIILDEAQNIRNRRTKISKAVTELEAIYRWALTGTPVTNTLADLYPLLRFLQIKPWYEWKEFHERVTYYEKRDPNVAGTKAQAILRTCMLRRKKDSKLDGKELIQLTDKTIDLHELEFSPEEREIYTFVETRAQVRFNKFLKAGTVMKKYVVRLLDSVLVLLLRLRQLCCHPSLIVHAEETLAKREEDKNKLKDEVERAADEVGYDFVRKAKKQRLDLALARMQAEKDGSEAADDECPVCMESPEQNENGAVFTRCCVHVFCRTCIEDVLAAPMRDDHDENDPAKKCKADQRPCPMCRAPVGPQQLYDLAAFEPSDFELTTATGEAMDVDDDDPDETLGGFIVNDEEDDDQPLGKKKKPVQQNRRVIQDSDDESEAEEVPEPGSSTKKDKGKGKEKSALELDWMPSKEPSAKMLWAYNKLLEIWRDHPDDKVIIISSFTSVLDLMEDYLKDNDIRTTRYQGDMNRQARDEALKILKKSKKCKVMLLSLKAGGVGLTLTRSNRIIALDLAWSPAVEMQAFDRVHRIGQEKDVFVERLTIANSVEQRILELQKKKQGLTDAAFGEGKAQKLGKLTVADLAGLFGLDKRGRRLADL
ncbi:hypothetical protein JCM8097_000134 [Rhodosporidiobolus ruineniae]